MSDSDNDIFPVPFNHKDEGECPVEECSACGRRDCPHEAPEHYWHDGCPACLGAKK